MKRVLIVLAVLMIASEAEAARWRLFRSRGCSTGNCSATVSSSPVQKADAVQKTDAVQKEAVQKEDAVQKEGPEQKSVDAVVVTKGSLLYNLCLRKARWQAARGRVGHPGWGMGGCHYEGAGSGGTPQAALNNCCYTGQRRVAASAVVRGANGRYYATKLYW